MSTQSTNRRSFLKTTAAIGALSAISQSRVLGANDRIQIASIGCGGRGRWHIGWLHRTAQDENLAVIAACDVWKVQQERARDEIQKRFDLTPKLYTDYREVLANPEIDAVVIATPDHQHCPMVTEAVKAGKDVYVEKPLAVNLADLNETYDTVKASDRIVQNGSQGRSSAGAAAAREFLQAGKLGKVFRVEEMRSHYNPYWNNYECPKSEAETNWPLFLFNLPYRPFNADMHGHWMGYRDFSPSGTIGGWMSHLADFIHYLFDCGCPVSATTQGGIYSPTSDPRRTCLDNVTTLLHYGEGFVLSFTTHFGSGANDYTCIYGDKGIMRMNEPDGNRDGIAAVVSGDGSEHPDKIQEPLSLDNTTKEDHMANWIRCIRTRQQPNANMEWGYKQGVACVLADQAYDEGRKMMFDPIKREIRPA
ncbi:MAG: Gfo/Idh/MocA family oxidoreductase [bacterium]|jgi:predicted dehydrogenase|nr:Gfo/Idh/MocA family oxidoreductase [bacterium]